MCLQKKKKKVSKHWEDWGTCGNCEGFVSISTCFFFSSLVAAGMQIMQILLSEWRFPLESAVDLSPNWLHVNRIQTWQAIDPLVFVLVASSPLSAFPRIKLSSLPGRYPAMRPLPPRNPNEEWSWLSFSQVFKVAVSPKEEIAHVSVPQAHYSCPRALCAICGLHTDAVIARGAWESTFLTSRWQD